MQSTSDEIISMDNWLVYQVSFQEINPQFDNLVTTKMVIFALSEMNLYLWRSMIS